MQAYGRHSLSKDDIEAVVKVLSGDWLTCGPVVEQFERKFCETVNSACTVSCSNGTTALHLALLALGIGPGDKVIVPAITFLASANAVRFMGAEVIFADCDPETGLMTAEILQKILSSKDS